jgi:hypothetical protein
MVLLFYMLTQVWTDNKPYLRVVPLYDQLREKHEVLQVDKSSLKIDEVIELDAQKWDHWAF